MDFKKAISSVLIVPILLCQIASASILGQETVKHAEIDIGHGAKLETNVFYSDQEGVGFQTENFVTYLPNNKLIPAIVNNSFLTDRMSVSSKGNELISQGLHPAMIINGDFFSVDEGFPVSHQIIDGEVLIKDYYATEAIGINQDGSAFMSTLSISATVNTESGTAYIPVVNMARTKWGVYMYTDRFKNETIASGEGINVIIGSLSGNLSVREEITGVVEEIITKDGPVEIPKGKIVLSADVTAEEDVLNQINLFKEGDKVTINSQTDGDERWNDAKYILGATGGRIITNSEITLKDATAAPRTAIGIKEDGSLIFYTIDGRQPGVSYGVRLLTLAKRLLELGCVDAINLDGGGSTALGALLPGGSKVSLINSPSDSAERKVPNFFALFNTGEKTGVPAKLFVYPYMGNYLSGTKVFFSGYATDENYYKAPLENDIEFILPDGTSSKDGNLVLKGNGAVEITAVSGSLRGSVTINSYDSPTYIHLRNTKTNSSVDSLNLRAGDSVSLSPSAKHNNAYLTADADLFSWSCSKDIGTIDQRGNFTAGENTASGEITVKAGSYTRKVPVTVTKPDPYTEVKFEDGGDGELVISFYTEDGSEIEDSNIVIKADGKKADFELRENKITLNFEDGFTHKVNVSVMNSSGYKTVANYTLSGEKFENRFSDIPENFWAEDYITYMYHHKIVNGVQSGKNTLFLPNESITRGEFAVMVANLMGINTENFVDAKTDFSDGESFPDWCSGHIKALYKLGIMNGKQAGDELVFDREATLTRAEAFTVLKRLLPENLNITEADFKDTDEIPSWAEDSFSVLSSLGIINGYTDKTIKPLNLITRSEVIKLLYLIY